MITKRSAKIAALILAAGSAMYSFGQGAAPTPPPRTGLIQQPSISPDGQLLVFSSGGDLWAVARTGGTATRLTSQSAEERGSVFSPDGKWLAFESERDGPRTIYIASIERTPTGVALGPIRRVTTTDRAQNLTGFTPDSKFVTFSSSNEPSIYRSNRLYKAPVEGGPTERLTGAFGTFPRVSPDGSFIVFTHGRADFNRPKYNGSGAPDLWKMNVATGQFERLTSDPRSDADGWPLPDGSVVYLSSKSGEFNLRRIPAGQTDAQATDLTNFQPTESELTIGHGARDLTVNAAGDTATFVVWDTLYTLDLKTPGAKPQPVAIVFSGDFADLDTQRLNLGKEVSEQAVSPDGKTLAVIARGQIFVRSTEENFPTRRVTLGSGRARGLAWSPDNRVLFFASDDTGTYQLYYATVALSKSDLAPPEEKKDDKKGDSKPDEKKPDKADDAKPADADKKDGADDSKKDEKKDDKPKIDFAKRWSEAITFDIHPLTPSNLSPGKNDGIFGPEFRDPTPSPDGKQLIFTRGLGDVILMDLTSRDCRVLWNGWNSPEILWAPDSRHILYETQDLDFNSDIWLLDTKPGDDGKVPVAANLTRHPDLDVSPRLSADGKVLYFQSERAEQNNQYQVYALALDKSLDALRPYELEEYFKKAAEAAKKRKPIDPVMWDKPTAADANPEGEKKEDKKAEAAKPLHFDTEDAYLRIRRVTSGIPLSSSQLAITPAGDRIIFSATGDPDPSLVSVSYKGDDRKSIQSGSVSNISVSLTGDKVFFIRQGTVSSAPPSGGKTEPLPIDAPFVVDVAAQQRQKFMEAARILGNLFYHPTLKGLNWTGLADRYVTLAQSTRTVGEFARVTMMLFGELEGSHVGVFPPPGSAPAQLAVGYLGLDTKPVPGGFEVVRILPRSPADNSLAGEEKVRAMRLSVGDVITAIDGQPLAGNPSTMPNTDLAAALVGKAGKETLISFTRRGDTPDPATNVIKPRAVLLTPLSSGADVDLRYEDEALRRAQLVDKLSGGKLGYLHIRAMGQASVDDYERDLYAAADGKLGLIIDVRDNGGGSTADILLASLTAPRHAYTISRGADPATVKKDAYPRDRRLIYGYSRDISVLINENSFSNAEIFAHAIKTINRGKLVGTPTYGGVISTGAATLIDGTAVRTPGRGWYLAADNADMENNGAKPDINVPQTPVEEAAEKDAQLEAAVKELLERAKEPK
ncbi:MAG: PD40 domain-containing protein [Phycisphaeraceae bacterium]|nr:PD40 domain-containing protein [Phycisphaeraceae bacterium]